MTDHRKDLIYSGIPWIGKIPNNWSIRPLWSMYQRIKDTNHPDEQMLSVFREHGVVSKTSYKNLNQTAENRNIYQLVHPGWLVTNRMKAWQGSVGISSLKGIVSGHYICFAPKHEADHGYLNWLFRSPPYIDGYRLISRGVRPGQAEIDNDHYRLLPVLLPPLTEQKRIADYLDRETTQIDTLIKEQDSLIKILHERRVSAIENTISGANPYPQEETLDKTCINTTPSSLMQENKWPSIIPSGWKIVTPKVLFSERRQTCYDNDVHLTPSQTYGVLPQSEYMKLTGNNVVLNIQSQDNMKHVEPDDFIIHLRSFQGGLERSKTRGKVSTAYTVLTPQKGVVPDYYQWLFKSDGYIQELRTTTNQLRDGQSIKYRDFTKVHLPLPPEEEQRAIADYLNREISLIDTLIAESEKLIELSRERRSALITAAVTGQIDIPQEV